MNAIQRNNVTIKGKGTQVMLFAHGFGCDQNMWRFVTPAFEEDYRVILFDHVGAGNSDLSAYSSDKYSQLEGYAADIVNICEEMELNEVIFVGHSVSSLMGMIASLQSPDLFKSLIMVSPSPSYINDGDYVGGFTREQITELMESLDNNHLGWSMTMAPVIMANPERAELSEELSNSFCRSNPDIAKEFARTTFFSDKRHLLPEVSIPSLILQCSEDVIAPEEVGIFMHKKIKDSQLVMMKATGHCPNLSAPEETIAAMKAFLK
ncbi:alpha/beta hydrolase [Kaistella sp. G5-32]|uniref:Alpha/beta hydrolase n=1 Tax=Kaistella gelatinilytica TaxID=2787636 RepID=A0ABS0F8X6_9FLAO|nr:alpha/beta hydrolase [Kaistella gelatinilytica]MBF8456148.1 alpha/beta hydrolase [Kaistella gelatinilytica]